MSSSVARRDRAEGATIRGVSRTPAACAVAVMLAACVSDETISPVPGEGGGATTSVTVVSSASTTAVSSGDGAGPPSAGGGSGEGGAAGGASEGGASEGGAGGDTSHGGGGCHPITIEDLDIVELVSGQKATYRSPLEDEVGNPGHDAFFLEAYGSGFGPGYDGEATGVFDLGSGEDSNYASCSRCFLAGDATIGLFQQSGTLTIDPASTHLGDGVLIATVTDLVLLESVFDPDTFESTPVEGGACLTVARAELVVPLPTTPPGWVCPERDHGAGDGCDCSCGAYDPDCDDPAQAIYFCGTPHFPGDGPGCLLDGTCENESGEWLCDQFWYGDGECDCGCGIQDFDCSTTDDENECQWCTTCDQNTPEFACFGVVDTNDTTRCEDER